MHPHYIIWTPAFFSMSAHFTTPRSFKATKTKSAPYARPSPMESQRAKARAFQYPKTKAMQNAFNKAAKALARAAKAKGKSAASRTATRRRNLHASTHIGDHVVKHFFFKSYWKPSKAVRLAKALSVPSISQSVSTFGATSSEGTQTVTTSGLMLDNGDLANLLAQASRYWNNTTTTIVAPGYAASGFKSVKFNLSHMESVLRIQNQAVSTCELDLYLLTWKNTTSDTTTPDVHWLNGLTDEAGGFTARSPGDAYTRPFVSKKFNMMIKVKKCWRVSLESGREAAFHYNFKPNMLLDSEYLSSTTCNRIKFVTHQWMLVTRGVMGDTNATGTVGNISLLPTKLICSNSVKTNVRMVSPFSRVYNYATSFTTGDAALKTIIPESGYVADLITNAVTNAVANA